MCRALQEMDKQNEERQMIFSELRKEADVQCEIMRQASNAVYACRMREQRKIKEAEIKAEKLLLVAGKLFIQIIANKELF